jgi:DNA-binding transcriptional ArsR family regulator
MPDRRHSDPTRDKALVALRESGLSVDAISERTGLSRRAIQQRLAAIMKKGGSGTISKSGISAR